MDNREMIERALGSFVSRGWREEMALKGWEFYKDDFLNALAKQAIVIECGVEHYSKKGNFWAEDQTCVHFTHPKIDKSLWLLGHHGTPGKAIAIIVPLEKEDE